MLPADVLDDPGARREFVEKLLTGFEHALGTPGGDDGLSRRGAEDAAALFRRVAQSLFVAHAARGAARTVGAGSEAPQRLEDGADDLDDPASLAPLVERLPERALCLELDVDALEAEVLGACLQQLGSGDAPWAADAVATRAGRLLAEAGPATRKVAGDYVQKALDPGANELPPEAVTNVVRALERHRQLPALRRHAGLSAERVAAHFPAGFVLFLKSLAPESSGDAAELARALAALDEAALSSGAARLLQQQEILQPALLRQLFGIGGRAALGLARHLLRANQPDVQAELAELLRALGGRRPEFLPLSILDARRLPAAYLQRLCDAERAGHADAQLREEVRARWRETGDV